MKTPHTLASSCLLVAALIAPSLAPADDGNWKKGRIYYRMVCTACHVEMGTSIPPASRRMNEWRSYFDAGQHDASGRSNPQLSYYTSRAYREAVQDSNRAAKKFLDADDATMFEDVRAFVIHGAADSDTPASCN